MQIIEETLLYNYHQNLYSAARHFFNATVTNDFVLTNFNNHFSAHLFPAYFYLVNVIVDKKKMRQKHIHNVDSNEMTPERKIKQ